MCVYLQTILETMPTIKGGLTEGSKKVFQAFAKDIDSMDKRIKNMNSDVQLMKDDMSNMKIDISNLNGKMDTVIELIENRLNSNVDNERIIGATVNSVLKSKKFWLICIIILILIMLSGVSLVYFIDHAVETATVVDAASKLL